VFIVFLFIVCCSIDIDDRRNCTIGGRLHLWDKRCCICYNYENQEICVFTKTLSKIENEVLFVSQMRDENHFCQIKHFELTSAERECKISSASHRHIYVLNPFKSHLIFTHIQIKNKYRLCQILS
jgi:hypothetical protein